MKITKLLPCALMIICLSSDLRALADTSENDMASKPVEQTSALLRGEMCAPAENEPSSEQLKINNGEDWHRVTLNLEGSMCPACLLELEGKLRAFPGILFAKIIRPSPTKEAKPDLEETESPGASSKPVKKEKSGGHASAILVFDNHTITFEKLNQCIKREQYRSLDVKEASIISAKQ